MFRRSSDSIALEQFADLIKQHNSYALRILAKQNGTDRCNSHQKVFIKYLFVQDSLPGLFQDIVSYNQIRHHVKQEPDNSLNRYENCNIIMKYRCD